MFKTIAEKVGPDLTIKNWQKTVNSFGKIDLVPTQIASFCKESTRPTMRSGSSRSVRPRGRTATGKR